MTKVSNETRINLLRSFNGWTLTFILSALILAIGWLWRLVFKKKYKCDLYPLLSEPTFFAEGILDNDKKAYKIGTMPWLISFSIYSQHVNKNGCLFANEKISIALKDAHVQILQDNQQLLADCKIDKIEDQFVNIALVNYKNNSYDLCISGVACKNFLTSQMQGEFRLCAQTNNMTLANFSVFDLRIDVSESYISDWQTCINSFFL